MVFDNIKGGKNGQVLIAKQEAEEILIDLDTLIDLSITPQDFPLPQDPKMRADSYRSVREDIPEIRESIPEGEVGPKLVTIRERQGSVRSKLQFHRVDEETIDEDQDVAK